MGNQFSAAKSQIRLWVQIGFAAVTNGYIKGFTEGRIYTGSLKSFCLPGLNCYSCPGALGSCPIGALQAVIASRNFSVSYYLAGFFLMVGAVLGRFVCGWLCPFGLFQDLLHKLPPRRKTGTFKGDRYLRSLKYGILVIFVILLPMFVLDFVGQGEPWFCKWICPSGTLMAGWPLALQSDGIRQTISFLFAWKSVILIALIVLSVFIYRPFCRYLCPLGAIYGLFNPVALYRYRIDSQKCTNCGDCQRACKLNICVNETPNSAECIRCGDCIRACGSHAIVGASYRKAEKNNAADAGHGRTVVQWTYKIQGREQFNMEKLFLRIAVVFFLVTTVAAAAFVQGYINDHPGKICVESKSCAINYMNKLEKEQE